MIFNYLNIFEIKQNTITSIRLRYNKGNEKNYDHNSLTMSLCNDTRCTRKEVQCSTVPYIDLRTLHYGFLFGLQTQDIEFENVGPQIIQNADGTQSTKTVVCDQDNWNPGFTVGVLAELRINTYISLRVVPTMHFGVKHITFHNLTDLTESGNPKEETQNLKCTYLSIPVDIKYSAERFNNYRPYIIAGINPMTNLTSSSQDFFSTKNVLIHVLKLGLGCDLISTVF